MAKVVVIGGALPGMAAAARLARARHQVTLVEAEPVLGGRLARPGVWAPVLDFPAPLKDLFRKSGRGFDGETGRRGLRLVAAPDPVHVFDDGTRLTWPADRGGQWHALAAAFDTATADRWRALLDTLDGTWQQLRHLGLEDELTGPAQVRSAGRLGLERTVAEVAALVGQEHLAQLVTDTAWQIGSDPRRTPGWIASRLSVDRLFGRWLLTDGDGQPLEPTALLGILTERLATRGVEVVQARVDAVDGTTVVSTGGTWAADAVISTVHPWTQQRLVPGGLRSRLRLARLRPALTPQIHSTTEAARDAAFSEEFRHTARGPVITYRRPTAAGTHVLVHDYPAGAPDRAAGLAWTGPRTWLQRPATRTAHPAVFVASAAGRGGSEPWAQLLGAALASYATHERLTGEDIRPRNRAYRP